MYETDPIYKVTDKTGKTWEEPLSEKDIALYQSWGWKVERV